VREFWCRFQHDDRDRATTFVKRELCEHLSNEYWDDEIIHTREVSPEYDELVEEMVKTIQVVLKRFNINHFGKCDVKYKRPCSCGRDEVIEFFTEAMDKLEAFKAKG
jgi:hypothetical protein